MIGILIIGRCLINQRRRGVNTLGRTLLDGAAEQRGELLDDYVAVVETGEPFIKESLIYAMVSDADTDWRAPSMRGWLPATDRSDRRAVTERKQVE
jgi:hypothetical protein